METPHAISSPPKRKKHKSGNLTENEEASRPPLPSLSPYLPHDRAHRHRHHGRHEHHHHHQPRHICPSRRAAHHSRAKLSFEKPQPNKTSSSAGALTQSPARSLAPTLPEKERHELGCRLVVVLVLSCSLFFSFVLRELGELLMLCELCVYYVILLFFRASGAAAIR